MNKSLDRIIVFDLIRSIAIMLVLFDHLMIVEHHFYSIWMPYGLGIGMFFFISGYWVLKALTKQTAIYFIVGRLFRLLPTLVFFIVVFSLYSILKHKHMQFSIWENIFHGIFFVGDYFQQYNIMSIDTWTLNVEWRFYVIASLSFAIFSLRNKITATCFIICFVFIVSTLVFLTFHFNRDTSVFCTPVFNNLYILLLLFGMLFYVYEQKIISRNYIIVCMVALVLVACTGYFIGRRNFLRYICGIFIAMAIVRFGKGIKWSSRQIKIITYIASISYPLYVCHHFFLNKIGYGFIPASWLCAHLTSKYIERPAMTWGKKIMQKHKYRKQINKKRAFIP